jgi:histidine triad (HIT) family protein
MIQDVFCKIIKGELKANEVYRDKDVLVIRDIKPQAPVHLLIMPIKHVDGVGDASPELLGKLVATAHRVARREGLTEGYRLVINEGQHGGKLVPHLHIHLLGGKALGPKIVA